MFTAYTLFSYNSQKIIENIQIIEEQSDKISENNKLDHYILKYQTPWDIRIIFSFPLYNKPLTEIKFDIENNYLVFSYNKKMKRILLGEESEQFTIIRSFQYMEKDIIKIDLDISKKQKD